MPKVLIVDDHESNVYLLGALFTGHGFQVVTASDGRAALEHARADKPDLIVSDILMPVMDGFAFCRLCRSDPGLADVPFVFYTATYTDPRDEQLALGIGADLFLVKPLEPEAFLSRINDVLERYRRGELRPHAPSAADEVGYLKEYNQALVRKLEDKLAALEEANRALLVKEFAIASAGSGIVLTDLEGRVTYANPAAAALVGRALVAGAGLSALFGDGACTADLVRSLAEGGEWRGELPTTDGQGSRHVVEAALRTVTDPAGQPVSRMMSFDDVTERKRMADEIQRSQRLASLSLFAAGIAHDFNNLLTGLFGNIELALSTVPADSVAFDHLATATVAFERARDLTRRLLAFAKGVPPSRKAHSVVELLQECAALSFVGSNLRFDITVPPGGWFVLGDANQLSQVFTNIFINARQAMRQGGLVQISVENCEATADDHSELAPGRYVCVSVTDEGPGIPPAVLSRVFDPLFTTKTDGSGLGLAMCYSIVQAHGGRIAVSSGAGAGATFRVWLPAGLRGETAAHAGPRSDAAGARERAHVLVMDDEPLIRDLAARMLDRGGHDVEIAGDGQEALDKCDAAARAAHPFDVVILDVTVPGAMGGLETLRRLQERHPKIAVVLSSGYGEESGAGDDCRPAGFLPKPYQRHEMLACVRAAARG